MTKKMNNKQATIKGLLAVGMVEIRHPSTKYRVFTPVSDTPRPMWLVGKSGALRYLSADDTAISQSVSKTGSIAHRAFMYCGRIAESVKDGISEDQYQDIMSAVRRGEIPVTKDGFHADAK
jgi:hypothetical protein